jgi:hypothetical protein
MDQHDPISPFDFASANVDAAAWLPSGHQHTRHTAQILTESAFGKGGAGGCATASSAALYGFEDHSLGLS